MKLSRLLIITTLCLTLIVPAAVSVHADEVEYVVFGLYPQGEAEETRALKNASYDKNGDAVVDGNKYRRVETDDGFCYFLYEPVKWLKNGNTLTSVNVLDCKMYDEQEEKIKDFMGGIKYANSVTWEECSIREWLNDEFLATAFGEDERRRISGEVRLFTASEANEINPVLLSKNATDYAVICGIEPRKNEFFPGDCEWLLKDISPITSSAVCTVKNNGSINKGMTVLVNEPGMGVVPCITLSDFSSLDSYSELSPEKTTELYYPGGRTALFNETEVQGAISNGWFADKADAMTKNGLDIKARFASSALSSRYDWRLYSSKGRNPYISIDAPAEDMTQRQVIEFLKPVMDTFYTGNMDDYMEVHATFLYSKGSFATLSEFSDNLGRSIHKAAEGCWSSTGNIICADSAMGRLTGTQGDKYSVTLRLKINSDGRYSLDGTLYNNTLQKLAADAKNYSSRPLGQLQYLRHYFGQNTVYDGRQFNNEPGTLVTSGVGVCGTYANFAADFCKLLGIPCIMYTNEPASHAWNGVYLEGRWYHMDHTGVSDKESMRRFYSDYQANGDVFSFDENGFPSEHTAENVNFIGNSYLPIDNLDESSLTYVWENFAQSTNPGSAASPAVKPEEQREITVLLKGQKLDFDVAPASQNGRTLVPMRKIFESLGATVYWNNDTRTATGVSGVTVISVTVDSDIMTKNGQNIALDVPARIVGTRTLVPLRVIAESFGLKVTWEQETYTVVIE